MRFGRDEAGAMYYQVRMDQAARVAALLDDYMQARRNERPVSTIAPSWPLTAIVRDHPPSANELRRLHPLVRYRRCKPFKEHVAWQCKALHLPAPLPRARVVATLTYTRRQFRDYDGAVASLKPCLDGLVVGRVLVDDGPAHLELHVRQEVGKERSVRLEIWPTGQEQAT